VESTVSVPQVVERRHKTINKFAGGLHGKKVPCKASRSERSWSCQRGYTVAWKGWEVTIDVTIHDKKFKLWQRGAGSRPLRQESQAGYKKIYHQEDVNELKKEGRVPFKFTRSSKNP